MEQFKAMHGKKITCYIKGVYIGDAELHVSGSYFYIRQNKVSGVDRNTGNYKYSYVTRNPEDYYVELMDPYEMPKLEAGMVVRVAGITSLCNTYLYVNDDMFLSTDGEGYVVIGSLVGEYEITEVYDKCHKGRFKKIESNFGPLIWQKQTPAQRKIAELEAAVKQALEQIEELKDER